MKKTSLLIALTAICGLWCRAQVYTADWESIDSRPIPEWFEDAKFGIFVHWGPYSVPAWAPTEHSKYSEWYWFYKDHYNVPEYQEFHNSIYGENALYQDFVGDFRAELFDPGLWADIFRDSGAKYVVLTSKHHDGYALWPSAQSWNWNSVDTGPHRDICGELTDAVKARDMKMGFYYSIYEWFNPVFRSDLESYVDNHMLPQFKDLVVRYEPDIVWPDGEWDYPSDVWKSTEFIAWLYNESPIADRVVINDRWGAETRGRHGGYYTTEYDHIPPTSRDDFRQHPWEECRGIGGSFGYNRNENLADYNSAAELIRMLLEKTAQGGNLLLNVGPTADGRIPVIMQQRLWEMGRWLEVNGEAIYGTRRWVRSPEITPQTDLFFTVKGDDLYAIVTRWPRDGFTIEGIGGTPSVTMLGTDCAPRAELAGGRLTVHPPQLDPGNVPCRHAWAFRISGAEF